MSRYFEYRCRNCQKVQVRYCNAAHCVCGGELTKVGPATGRGNTHLAGVAAHVETPAVCKLVAVGNEIEVELSNRVKVHVSFPAHRVHLHFSNIDVGERVAVDLHGANQLDVLYKPSG